MLIIIYRQPGANIIDTVDRVRSELPQLQASVSQAIHMQVALDQTVTIRASVKDVERSLAISVVLVVLVVFFFLRNARTTFIPSVAVPVSLIGTFGVMYLAGFSVDNLSMMALTISTGFVVDDAIVVIENISDIRAGDEADGGRAERGGGDRLNRTDDQHLAGGGVYSVVADGRDRGAAVPRVRGNALGGDRNLDGDLSDGHADDVRVPVEGAEAGGPRPDLSRIREGLRLGGGTVYATALRGVLRYSFLTLLVLLGTIALTGYLFYRVPKGFFPAQDTGRLNGNIQADQDTSFQELDHILQQYENILHADSSMDTVMGFAGGGNGRATDTARSFMSLKPLGERTETAQAIIARLRPKLAKVPGATLFLSAAQDVRVGGRQSNADYQSAARRQRPGFTCLNRRCWMPCEPSRASPT